MADPWTDAWEEAEATAPPSIVVYDTLELMHDAFPEPIRLITGMTDDVTLTLEVGAPYNGGEDVVFTAVQFSCERPEIAEGKTPECPIAIDNVADTILPILEDAVKIRSDLSMIYRQYRSDDTSEPCFGPTTFNIKSVVLQGTTLTGRAKLEDLVNKKFPNLVYTYEQYPGLLNG